jgi:hypothetical protein
MNQECPASQFEREGELYGLPLAPSGYRATGHCGRWRDWIAPGFAAIFSSLADTHSRMTARLQERLGWRCPSWTLLDARVLAQQAKRVLPAKGKRKSFE